MQITCKQAHFLLDAVEWAVGDGMTSPDKEEAQVIQQLMGLIKASDKTHVGVYRTKEREQYETND